MPALVIKSCGALTTLQDAGRFGYQRFGLSPAGAMDKSALAIANALVGNDRGTAALEFAVMGGDITVDGGDVRIAVAGADCALSVGGESLPPLTSRTVRAGETIRVGVARTGVFFYLAVGGGFDLEPQLGSLSVHLRAGIGGSDGRPARAGDRLPVKAPSAAGPQLTLLHYPSRLGGPLRVVLGPQDDHFSAEGLSTFLSSEYTITADADRMGFRLAGPRIAHANGFNIVSDGIVTGSIQVPGAGEPIILLADRQTTGGYPKIATLASVEIARLGQMRPGSKVRFLAIDRGGAVALARAEARQLAQTLASIRPAGVGAFDTESLLAANLAGDAVDARV